MAREKEDGRFLAAYYVSGRKIEPAELRGYLSQQLPDYMMPSYFVHMQAMPLSANGKLNRNALPEPVLEASTVNEPLNETEIELISIWSEILSIKKEMIGTKTNFFDMGGHSLRMIRMNKMIRDKFNVEIPVRTLFKLTTIQTIADFIIRGVKENKELELGMAEREDALGFLDTYIN